MTPTTASPSGHRAEGRAGHRAEHRVEGVAERNVRTVKDMEAEARAERTPGQRFVDGITALVSTVQFWAFHAALLAVWCGLNGGLVPGVPRWDPWPFETLRTLLSLEAIMISCTVLLIQGRMRQNTTRQQHLNLQIALLAEVEATKTLAMVRALCLHHGLAEPHDPEVEQLVRRLAPDALAEEVQEHLTPAQVRGPLLARRAPGAEHRSGETQPHAEQREPAPRARKGLLSRRPPPCRSGDGDTGLYRGPAGACGRHPRRTAPLGGDPRTPKPGRPQGPTTSNA